MIVDWTCFSFRAFQLNNFFLLFQAMGCCGQAEEGDEDKKARKQNKEIEKQIQKDKQVVWKSSLFLTQNSKNCYYQIKD